MPQQLQRLLRAGRPQNSQAETPALRHEAAMPQGLETWAARVQDTASEDLCNMGLVVVSFTIQRIA